MKLKTLIRRPQDCRKELLEQVVKIVCSGGEMNEKFVRGGLPYAEALVLTGSDDKLIGVSVLKHPRQSYLKHLYTKAGVLQMFNPYSIESCWIAVLPEYRGQGVWSHNKKEKMAYLANRPYHSVRRVANTMINNPEKEEEYQQAGQDFISYVSPEPVRLMVANHDPIFNPKKKMLYMEPAT